MRLETGADKKTLLSLVCKVSTMQPTTKNDCNQRPWRQRQRRRQSSSSSIMGTCHSCTAHHTTKSTVRRKRHRRQSSTTTPYYYYSSSSLFLLFHTTTLLLQPVANNAAVVTWNNGPEDNFFCGHAWDDPNCATRQNCRSGRDSECEGHESHGIQCFANTNCDTKFVFDGS